MLEIYVDADACPVKNEVYRVAKRYGLHVTLVANSWISYPGREGVDLGALNPKRAGTGDG